jgi:hypothetical protein
MLILKLLMQSQEKFRISETLYARRLTHASRVSLILLLPAAFEDLSGLHASKVDDRIQFASLCWYDEKRQERERGRGLVTGNKYSGTGILRSHWIRSSRTVDVYRSYQCE